LRALVAASVDGLHAEDVVLVLDVTAAQAQVMPTPLGAPDASNGLRAMVVVLGLVLAVLAAALIIVFFRLRKEGAAASSPSSAPPSQRPVIAPSVQRKVA
ncbi:MAG: hypothetical protein IAE78_19745, partial [Myxococcus sp.]|nr:hypothetical protein [Myxococcus sp.]